MSSISACPLPQVEEALAPYIHTRQETQQIRQAIAQHISSLSQSHQRQDPFLLDCASPSLDLGEEPGPLNGLQKRYYEALRANTAARRSYQQVKQELEDLRTNHLEHTSKLKGESAETSVRSYIKDQKQRQQHAKLNIIQDTLAKLTEEAPRTLHDDLGTLVREDAGEAPEAPKSSMSSSATTEQVTALVFRLKRELLLAKHAAEKQSPSSRNSHINGNGGKQPNVSAQVQALRVTRDQLIAWIEGELAKISEDEGDSSIMEGLTSGAGDTQGADLASEDEMLKQIQTLYSNYVVARQKLAQNIDAALEATHKQPDAKTASSTQGSASSSSKPAASTNVTYADLITCVPTFVHAARTERALLHQASYLRRQLIATSDETKATVQRLAGESYLVPPDATNMDAWATAAAAKTRETNAFVEEQLRVGQISIDATADGLAKTETRNKALHELRGDL